jgi:hypothetical protein
MGGLGSLAQMIQFWATIALVFVATPACAYRWLSEAPLREARWEQGSCVVDM